MGNPACIISRSVFLTRKALSRSVRRNFSTEKFGFKVKEDVSYNCTNSGSIKLLSGIED